MLVFLVEFDSIERMLIGFLYVFFLSLKCLCIDLFLLVVKIEIGWVWGILVSMVLRKMILLMLVVVSVLMILFEKVF